MTMQINYESISRMINKKFINALLISLLISINTLAVAKSPPPGTGEADVKANIFILLDTSGSMQTSVPGPVSPGQLAGPNDVDVDSAGNVHTINWTGKYISVHDNTGTGITSYGSINSSAAKIAVDRHDNTYTKQGNKLNKYTKGGTNSWTHTWTVTLPNGFSQNDNSDIEAYVSRDDEDYILVTDSGKNIAMQLRASDGGGGDNWALEGTNTYPIAIDYINQFFADGRTFYQLKKSNRTLFGHHTFVTLGTTLSSKSLGSNTSNGGYSNTYDIEVDRDGNVYLADTSNKIHKYHSARHATTPLGYIGSKNCPGMGSIYGLGVDKTISGNGTVYVPNYGGNKVIKINMAGDDPNAWSCGTTITSGGSGGSSNTRIGIAKDVIQTLMQDSSLTDGANFGLMTWDNTATIRVPVKQGGHQEILGIINSITAPGPSTRPGIAVALAKDFFDGNTSFPSPIDPTANCQNNFVILISDGAFHDNPNATVLAMYNQKGIKSYIVGFAFAGGSTYQSFATAGQTGAPLYATDQATLLATLGDAIRQVLQQSLTFSAPKIMPDVNLGDHIFQAVFDYKTRKQWHGKLKKYALATAGSITTPVVWEAGEQLNLIPANNRKIWSVGSNFALPNTLNNFVHADLGTIKFDLYEGGTVPTLHNVGGQANKLLEFVRGKDSYDYDNDSNTTEEQLWKLADIYHSEPTIVGRPPGITSATKIYSEAFYRNTKNYNAFKTAQNNRKNIIVAGSNAGLLHAFDNLTGKELWAFIPPSVLPKLRAVADTSSANATDAIYGVDGSPVVKDIYYGGSWKTVLICGLGRGGNSYFALDITDTENPKHLFTFSNDPVAEIVYHWDDVGNRTRHEYGPGKTIDPSYDYSLLGEAWSTPKILRMRIGTTDKWVAVFGAGFNNNANSAYGSGVFVIDMEDEGKVLKSIALTDNNDPDATANCANTSPPSCNKVINSVPANIVPVTNDGSTLAEYYGALVYVTDYEGKLWKINLTNNGTLYDAQIIFDAEASFSNERRVMHEVAASVDARTNKLWLYFGTGDQQNLANENASIANKFYGIKDKDFPNYDTILVSATETNCLNTTNLTINCIVGLQQDGWYYNLGASEKVTSKPSIFNRNVYVSKYTPNAANPCAPGTAAQAAYKYNSGCRSRDDVNLGSGVATAATFYQGKMYLGLSGASSSDNTLDGNSDFNLFDSIIVGTPVGGSNTSNHPQIKTWRELK